MVRCTTEVNENYKKERRAWVLQHAKREMELKITDTPSYKPDEAFIQETEGVWGVKLPAEYRQFLKEFNGGIPDKGQFMCEGQGQVRKIEHFMCILEDADNDDGYYDIDATLTPIFEDIVADPHFLGYEIIPIAELVDEDYDLRGDFVCLDFRESKENPSVCVWDHLKSREFKPVTYKVADTYTEFIDMLF